MRRSGRSLLAAGLFAAAAVALARPAEATYSIVGVDMVSQQVGGAGTSCVPFDVAVIYASAPGIGVVHAQAQLNQNGRDEAQRRLQMGESPQDIMAVLSSNSFDGNHPRRQYLAADLMGRRAGYTGNQTGNWSGHADGMVDDFVFVAAGNILTGPEVVDDTGTGFHTGCDLADRLMQGLELGRSRGGDSRCTPAGRPADSAFIQVDLPAQRAWLQLSVVDTGPRDPVTELRAAYDVWRSTNPCPAPPDAGLPVDTGVVDAPADAEADAGADVMVADAPNADRPAAETGADAAPQDANDPADLGVGDQARDIGPVLTRPPSGNCGCSHLPHGNSGSVWLLGLFYLLLLGRIPRVKLPLR